MKSRLKQIRNELGLTQGVLAEILGCSKNNISMIETGKSTLTERNKKWLVQSLNINPEWLESGQGEMRLTDAVYTECEHSRKPKTGIPIYDLNENELHLLLRHDGGFKPSGYFNMPRLPECDGAVYVAGDSMAPILRSGDLVLYRRLVGTSEIFWGDMYLISVETSGGEYVAVRYIRKSRNKGKAVLAGEGPYYEGTEIELSKIKALAFVKATFRLNSTR